MQEYYIWLYERHRHARLSNWLFYYVWNKSQELGLETPHELREVKWVGLSRCRPLFMKPSLSTPSTSKQKQTMLIAMNDGHLLNRCLTCLQRALKGSIENHWAGSWTAAFLILANSQGAEAGIGV